MVRGRVVVRIRVRIVVRVRIRDTDRLVEGRG